jgi:hypothetical protein
MNQRQKESCNVERYILIFPVAVTKTLRALVGAKVIGAAAIDGAVARRSIRVVLEAILATSTAVL